MDNKTPSATQAKLEPNDYVAWPYTVPNIFSAEECERVIKLSDELPVVEGPIGVGDNRRFDTEIRESTQKWLELRPDTKWIFHRIYDAVAKANELYKFELYGFRAIQITRYDIGGHYTWHPDLGKGVGSLRKLSISVQLSAPEDYDGGKLEFQTLEGEIEHSRDRGTTILFPPFMVHRITPVTRGTRWALVAWVKGPPFR